jgi:hypothetical protein
MGVDPSGLDAQDSGQAAIIPACATREYVEAKYHGKKKINFEDPITGELVVTMDI